MSAARSRDIRRLAFQALFQLDARAESQPDELRATLEEIAGETAPELQRRDVERALELALAAYQRRRDADQAIADLAPAWPAPRQPAVDRAILRLAYHEMTSAGTSPKVVVNEAVELAKKFSTERSPAFVNGVLDKVLKKLVTGVAGDGGSAQATGEGDAEDSAAAGPGEQEIPTP